MDSIYQISEQLMNIYDELESGVGIDEETGEIDQEILNALVITKNELQTKAIDYAYVIKTFDDNITIYDKEIKRLTERKKQFQKIQDRLKEIVKNAMVDFGMTEIKGKTLKLSLRKSEAVEVLDLNELDEKFKRTKITIEPDKVAIKNAIDNGEEINGAVLVKKDNLQIR